MRQNLGANPSHTLPRRQRLAPPPPQYIGLSGSHATFAVPPSRRRSTLAVSSMHGRVLSMASGGCESRAVYTWYACMHASVRPLCRDQLHTHPSRTHHAASGTSNAGNIQVDLSAYPDMQFFRIEVMTTLRHLVLRHRCLHESKRTDSLVCRDQSLQWQPKPSACQAGNHATVASVRCCARADSSRLATRRCPAVLSPHALSQTHVTRLQCEFQQ